MVDLWDNGKGEKFRRDEKWKPKLEDNYNGEGELVYPKNKHYTCTLNYGIPDQFTDYCMSHYKMDETYSVVSKSVPIRLADFEGEFLVNGDFYNSLMSTGELEWKPVFSNDEDSGNHFPLHIP